MDDLSNKLELTPALSAVAQAVQWLEHLGARHGWPPRLQFALTLCVDEALTNIVSYAFSDAGPMAASPYVRLMHREDARGVHIDIHDNGVAFDPTRRMPPPDPSSIETATIGGHGVQLMRHYLKDLSYTRTSDENRLTLTAALPDTTGVDSGH